MHGANLRYFSKKYNINENNIIDFSSNINMFRPDIDYINIATYIEKNINKYPDISYIDLKKDISSIYEVNSDTVYVGNGATEILYDILSLEIFKNIGIFNPSFSEYERASLIFKKNIIDLDIEKLSSINIHTKIEDFFENIVINKEIFHNKIILPNIIILCNPNNPTGLIYNLIDLLRFCEKNNIFLLVDETFIDFCNNDKYSMLKKKSKKLIIINAITKFFAMTGARLGYCFCENKEILYMLEEIKKPWSINILAQCIAHELVNIDKSFYYTTKRYYDEETKRLYEKYKKIAHTKQSYSCFLYLTFQNIDVLKLQKYLIEKHSIIVRVLNNYKNIDNNSIRIAIKSKEENDRLFDTIMAYLGGEDE